MKERYLSLFRKVQEVFRNHHIHTLCLNLHSIQKHLKQKNKNKNKEQNQQTIKTIERMQNTVCIFAVRLCFCVDVWHYSALNTAAQIKRERRLNCSITLSLWRAVRRREQLIVHMWKFIALRTNRWDGMQWKKQVKKKHR